jgi:threonine aldolase
MIFSSDNWTGAHPKIAESLMRHSSGYEAAYGNGTLDKRVAEKFNEIFEHEVSAFFVATGTAANSLGLASVARPGGVIFSSREAHILTDESGAPEYLSGGSRVRGIAGTAGKMGPDALRRALEHFEGASVHSGQPGAASITQSTELGTVYSLDEIDEISAIAKSAGIPLHMDGARFANGLVALGCTPAEMTWKRGVDFLSFGGTKNGCWCAEAVIFFDPAKTRDFPFLRMRAGHLHSKSRFIAAQFDAYLTDDLWLDSARHANAMARALGTALANSNSVRLPWQPQANEVFAIMPATTKQRLQAAGAKFYDWETPAEFENEVGDDEQLCRFVTSFETKEADVSHFSEVLKE